MYTNADQLRNKMAELSLNVVSEDPQFIFVTEVLPKYNPDNITCSSILFNIDGYTAFQGKMEVEE